MSLGNIQLQAAHIYLKVAAGSNLTDLLTQVKAQEEWTAQEWGTLQDLSYGTQRYRGSLNAYLRLRVPKPLSEPKLEALLMVAMYQLLYTQNAQHAVVNEAVQASQKLADGKFKSLLNAVLRQVIRDGCKLPKIVLQDDVEAKFNFPEWWVEKLKKDYPKYWHNILAASQLPPPLTLRVNQRHTTGEAYLALLAEQGLEATLLGSQAVRLKQATSVANLPQFYDGVVSVQDWGAQQAALLLDPQNGERILDACAAPGGKTGHLLELADIDLLAIDVDSKRLRRVQENVDRLGLPAQIKAADATKLDAWYDGQPFDAVLADVPCTASGVVKRHPDIKWLRRRQDAASVAQQQHVLLDVLWSTVKSGGRMLLATCSIFPEENQQQLQAFLERHSDATLRTERICLPNDTQDGFYYSLIDKA
ncbi:16S rRNA (cytosine(967)-C(5))-methyltransferase RsmB [Vitreoscilla stercoraria]|uniref:16S rRNA (cytosine(967)-C(5))-methyltransferase n=1 Tax=Vitreoscilla stercoraria TaxID=61 RepID=A0ABY4EAK7_VITST|nr:16S rRNA (cytosine(967)-C(5))-methyltransferase RsmB [Vitreoscilla stercoraria]UOO92269.1 16S rRNA (cytosine(967)-C(5))-methyltransferase RsmB [Vitreoscilla stercoraria]